MTGAGRTRAAVIGALVLAATGNRPPAGQNESSMTSLMQRTTLLHSSKTQTRVAKHSFGHRHAHIHWDANNANATNEQVLTIMHITDSHVSSTDAFKPYTTRMFNAFAHTSDQVTGRSTTPGEELQGLLKKACDKKVDLIALGGDIINFPTEAGVSWLLDSLKTHGCGTPFIYTAGNHDWHVEGLPSDTAFDSQRLPEINTTLKPLYDASAMTSGTPLASFLELKGVGVLTVDNSNHQITPEQLAFAKDRLSKAGGPVVMMVHIPFALPGQNLDVSELCGHPDWGTKSDKSYEVEKRPKWPAGNLPSTMALVELVRKKSAPAGNIVAVLGGHVHREFSNALAETPVLASTHTVLSCDDSVPGCSLRAGGSTHNGNSSSSFLHTRGGPRLRKSGQAAAAAEIFQMGSALGAEEELSEAEGGVQYSTLDAAEGGFRLVQIHLQHTPETQ